MRTMPRSPIVTKYNAWEAACFFEFCRCESKEEAKGLPAPIAQTDSTASFVMTVFLLL